MSSIGSPASHTSAYALLPASTANVSYIYGNLMKSVPLSAISVFLTRLFQCVLQHIQSLGSRAQKAPPMVHRGIQRLLPL